MANFNLVIDANIFIAFNEVKLFDSLLRFLGKRIDAGDNVFIPSTIIDECHGLERNIRSVNELNEISKIDSAVINDLKKKAKPFKMFIHSATGADFDLLACAIKNKATHIICNDRALMVFFNRYKPQASKFPFAKNIMGLSLANFIDWIYKLDKSFWGENPAKLFVKTNIDFYSECEIDSFCVALENSLSNQIDGIKTKKDVRDFMGTWPQQAKDTFQSYGENVYSLF